MFFLNLFKEFDYYYIQIDLLLILYLYKMIFIYLIVIVIIKSAYNLSVLFFCLVIKKNVNSNTTALIVALMLNTYLLLHQILYITYYI